MASTGRRHRTLEIALCVSFALAALVSPFASSSPDGLERVAHDLGFIGRAEEAAPLAAAPLPDYSVPGVSSGAVSVALAGVIGTLVTLGAAVAVGALVRTTRVRAGR